MTGRVNGMVRAWS